MFVCVCEQQNLVKINAESLHRKTQRSFLFLLNAVKSKVRDFILAEFEQVQKMERGITRLKKCYGKQSS